MPQSSLLTKMEEYINANNTCVLATGTGTFIRNTPIEYSYHDGYFWMFSEEYNAHAAYKKIPLSALQKMAPPMNLIRVSPVWKSYPDKAKEMWLNNAFCHNCGVASFKPGYNLRKDKFGIVIQGYCSKCGERIARFCD